MLDTFLIALAFVAMAVITLCVYMRNRQLQKDNRRLDAELTSLSRMYDRTDLGWSQDCADLTKTVEVLAAERDQAWHNLEMVLSAETDNAELIKAQQDRDLAMQNLEMVLEAGESTDHKRSASVEVGRAGVYYRFDLEPPTETDPVITERSST